MHNNEEYLQKNIILLKEQNGILEIQVKQLEREREELVNKLGTKVENEQPSAQQGQKQDQPESASISKCNDNERSIIAVEDLDSVMEEGILDQPITDFKPIHSYAENTNSLPTVSHQTNTML
jgi:hypothetical protein